MQNLVPAFNHAKEARMRAFEESNFQQSEIDLISAKFESLSCLPQA
jgi:hypothetical protein